MLERAASTHKGDIRLHKIIEGVQPGERPDFELKDDILRFRSTLCVPDAAALRDEILREAHSYGYPVHSGRTKMYLDLRGNFWWFDIKEITEFVAQFLACQ